MEYVLESYGYLEPTLLWFITRLSWGGFVAMRLVLFCASLSIDLIAVISGLSSDNGGAQVSAGFLLFLRSTTVLTPLFAYFWWDEFKCGAERLFPSINSTPNDASEANRESSMIVNSEEQVETHRLAYRAWVLEIILSCATYTDSVGVTMYDYWYAFLAEEQSIPRPRPLGEYWWSLDTDNKRIGKPSYSDLDIGDYHKQNLGYSAIGVTYKLLIEGLIIPVFFTILASQTGDLSTLGQIGVLFAIMQQTYSLFAAWRARGILNAKLESLSALQKYRVPSSQETKSCLSYCISMCSTFGTGVTFGQFLCVKQYHLFKSIEVQSLTLPFSGLFMIIALAAWIVAVS